LIRALGLACLFPGIILTASAAPVSVEFEPTIEPLSHKNYTEKFPNSHVEFDMVAIPWGTFLMGSSEDETGRQRDEGPQHLVKLRPFWMGKTEVTWDEYELFREHGVASDRDNDAARALNADAVTRPTTPYPDEYRGFGNEGYPVVGISHHAAMEYCYWLTQKTGKVYRLPTEAEWEFACRAGGREAYFFGDNAGNLKDYAWYRKNSAEATHPVGKKKPNPWGLHDMYGNVAEWCLDHYQKDFYAAFPMGQLTLGPVKKPTASRYPHVVRGGSWENSADRCRSAARLASDPSWNKVDPEKPQSIWWVWNADTVGFRIVRPTEEYDELKGIRSQVTKMSK